MKMEILQLKYFCDAAEGENFSHTAHKYDVPPSNISQTVHRLEDELGFKLFDRSANRITLNEPGRRFYVKVKAALRMLDDACRELSDMSENVQTEIRLKVCTNRRIVTKAIEEFKKLYPDVNFTLSHNYSDEGEFDLIISDIAPDEKNMTKQLLITEKILVAAKKDNPVTKMKISDIASLKNERFISMPDKSSLCRLTEEICKRADFEPNIVIKSDDPYYVRRYIELGLGIAFVPAFSWQGQFSHEILCMDICDFFRDTYVFADSKRYMSKAVAKFRDILFEVCGEG